MYKLQALKNTFFVMFNIIRNLGMYDDYKKLILKYIEKLFNYNHLNRINIFLSSEAEQLYFKCGHKGPI